jgi:hypothetical protein
VRGKERGSTRRAKATCGRSREDLGWPESSYPRWAGPAAEGARRRGNSGEQRREWAGWGGSVKHGEAHSAVELGRRRAEEGVPRRPELTAAAMEERQALYAREVPRAVLL